MGWFACCLISDARGPQEGPEDILSAESNPKDKAPFGWLCSSWAVS
jgi:hypothetical protein